jgi:hypothetical protein
VYLAAAIVGLVLVGLFVGAALNFAPAFLAIPLALVVAGVLLLGRARRRPRGGEEPVDFTERDRDTLYSGGPERAREAAARARSKPPA